MYLKGLWDEQDYEKRQLSAVLFAAQETRPRKMRNKAIFKLSAYEDTGLEPEEVWVLKRQMRERDETNPSKTAGLE